MGIIKPEREEAFKLFEAGLNPVEVAKKITNVNFAIISCRIGVGVNQ